MAVVLAQQPAAMSASAPGKIRLTYFNIEGRAEKIRLALTLGGIDFEDHRVGMDAWEELKPKTKYRQLPEMQIGDGEPVAQSGAMLRYAGHLAGLYPAEHLLDIEEVIGLEEDLGNVLAPSMYIGMKPYLYGYPKDMPQEERTIIQMKLRSKLLEADGDLLRMLGYLEHRLVGGNECMVGNKITIADCQVIPRLRQLKKGILEGIPKTLVDGYPHLSAYYDRFHAIPSVKAYYDKLEAKR